MSKIALKLTQQKAEIHLEATGAMNETISLATDLLCSGETLDGNDIKVNIHEIKYSIIPTDEIIITRGTQIVARLTNSGIMSFVGSYININNTDDLVVTTTGTAPGAFCVLSLTKVSGFAPTVPNQGI